MNNRIQQLEAQVESLLEERQHREPIDYDEVSREESRSFVRNSRHFTFELTIEESTTGIISHPPTRTHLAFCTGQCESRSVNTFLQLINGDRSSNIRAYICDTTENNNIRRPLQIQVETSPDILAEDIEEEEEIEPGVVSGRVESLGNWGTDSQNICLRELRRTLQLDLQGTNRLLRNVQWAVASRNQIGSSNLTRFVKFFLPKSILEGVRIELQCHPLDRRLCSDPLEQLALRGKLSLRTDESKGLGGRVLWFIKLRILVVKKLLRYRLQEATRKFYTDHKNILSWVDLVYLDTAVTLFFDIICIWLGIVVIDQQGDRFQEKVELHQVIEKLFFFPVKWTWKTFNFGREGTQVYYWTQQIQDSNYFTTRLHQNIAGGYTSLAGGIQAPTLQHFESITRNFPNSPERIAFLRAITAAQTQLIVSGAVSLGDIDFRINQRINYVTSYWRSTGNFSVVRENPFNFPTSLNRSEPLIELIAVIGDFNLVRNLVPEINLEAVI
jgi:hypothetical protein